MGDISTGMIMIFVKCIRELFESLLWKYVSNNVGIQNIGKNIYMKYSEMLIRVAPIFNSILYSYLQYMVTYLTLLSKRNLSYFMDRFWFMDFLRRRVNFMWIGLISVIFIIFRLNIINKSRNNISLIIFQIYFQYVPCSLPQKKILNLWI